MLLRLIQYKSYDSYSRSELQGQLGRPFAVHYLYYSTDSFLCQVKIVLICFCVFYAMLYHYFLNDISPLYFCTFYIPYIIGRNSLQKYILDVQKPCLTRHSAVISLARFYTQNHKLIQLYHIIHLTFCQVKIA